jgi:hypothetical protein
MLAELSPPADPRRGPVRRVLMTDPTVCRFGGMVKARTKPELTLKPSSTKNVGVTPVTPVGLTVGDLHG